MKDMAGSNIETVILRELTELTDTTVPVTAETNIARELGLDSMAVMDLTMALEDEFDISIAFDEIAQTETVMQLTDLVQKLQTEAHG
jgi:acyl carrier protein